MVRICLNFIAFLLLSELINSLPANEKLFIQRVDHLDESNQRTFAQV